MNLAIPRSFSAGDPENPYNNTICEECDEIGERNLIKSRTICHHVEQDTRKLSDSNSNSNMLEISLSSLLTTSYLMEYMYYIIQGILNIGIEIRNEQVNYEIK